jgi:hypothetical protein
MFERDLEVPKKEPVDYVHTAVKTAIASIQQWWAAPAAELFSLVFSSPIEKRRDEFCEDVVWVIRETASRVDELQPERLAENEAFISATMQAARIAISTHQREKLEYLRNALLNTALNRCPDEDKQTVFWDLIGSLSATHIVLLHYFDDRGAFSHERRLTLMQRRELTDLMILEMASRGLLKDPRPYVARNRESEESLAKQDWSLTPLGKEFLSFVAIPEPLG